MHITLPVTLAVLFVFFWLCFTEFTYVSKRLHRWWYWLFSRRAVYERKWKSKAYASKEVTDRMFVEPLRKSLGESPEAGLLDLACGSGRTSLLLLQEPGFAGRIDAVDFSEGMLDLFRRHLQDLPEERRSQVALTCQDVTTWRCPSDRRYDAATLLEVSEFLREFPAVVAEVGRALKPGGLLLLTRPAGRFAWLFVGRHQTRRKFVRLLEQSGFDRVEMVPWTFRYQVVYAWKRQNSFDRTTG